MPVLQWGMLCVLSLLLSIGFLALHLPAALLLGPMIAGIIFSMRGVTLQLPRSAFLAAQAILGCMIAQNLTGSILTTLVRQLVDRACDFTGDAAFQRHRGLVIGAL